MRWEGFRRSENVEDRTEMGPAGGGGFPLGGGGMRLGGGAIIVLLIVSLLFGINPLALLPGRAAVPATGTQPTGSRLWTPNGARARPRASRPAKGLRLRDPWKDRGRLGSGVSCVYEKALPEADTRAVQRQRAVRLRACQLGGRPVLLPRRPEALSRHGVF